jgi:magnesium transporter
LRETLERAKLNWMDLSDPTAEDIAFLRENYPFDALNLEDCTSRRQLSKLDQRDAYVFVVVHFPFLDEQTGLILPRQLSMFVGESYVVTVHSSDFKQVSDLFEKCRSNDAEAGQLLGKSPANLVYGILDRLVDEIFPLADTVVASLNDIEDRVFDERLSSAAETTRLQRQIASLRRLVVRLKRVVTDLEPATKRFAFKDLSPYFGDLRDHIERLLETVDEASETIGIFSNADYNLSTEKTNRVLAILTIIFTLTIPLTVLSGLYGMNVILPGGVTDSVWTFAGPYSTLLVILLVSLVPAIVLFLYMRRQKWI